MPKIFLGLENLMLGLQANGNRIVVAGDNLGLIEWRS